MTKSPVSPSLKQAASLPSSFQDVDSIEFWLRHWQCTRQILKHQVIDVRPFVRQLQAFCNPSPVIFQQRHRHPASDLETAASDATAIALAPETWVKLEAELLMDEAQAAVMGYATPMDMIMEELYKPEA